MCLEMYGIIVKSTQTRSCIIQRGWSSFLSFIIDCLGRIRYRIASVHQSSERLKCGKFSQNAVCLQCIKM